MWPYVLPVYDQIAAMGQWYIQLFGPFSPQQGTWTINVMKNAY